MAYLYLVTLPPSHFSEKARWALDLLGKPYTEERHAPPFHRFALKRINARKTAPALLVSNKTLLPSSKEILKWVDGQLAEGARLFPKDPAEGPIVEDFCDRADNEFAMHVARFIFYHLDMAQYKRIMTAGVAEDEARKFNWIAPLVRFGMNKALKINEHSWKNALRQMDKFFEKVEHQLSDGRKFLYCNRLTAADVTFCSLAAPALLVKEYGGARIHIEEAPPLLRTEVDRLRATQVGTYVQAVYKTFRKGRL